MMREMGKSGGDFGEGVECRVEFVLVEEGGFAG